MASLENKLHECFLQVNSLLFEEIELPPCFETYFGYFDKNILQLPGTLYWFGFPTLERIEKSRQYMRSKVNNINCFFAWTTYFSNHFFGAVRHFDPFQKSEYGSKLQKLNEQIYHLAKQLHQTDVSRYVAFGIFHRQEDKTLLFLFDMRKECPNFQVCIAGQTSKYDKRMLYTFFLRDRTSNFNSSSQHMFPDFLLK